MTSARPYDAVIVGAGPAGSATAALLAERGFNVALLDRAAFPRLMDWWDRSMARPAARFVYANGTEETPERPPKKSIAGIFEFRV